MRSESIEFSSEGHSLFGVLTPTDSTSKMGVVLLHPHPLFGGDMDNHVVITLERVFLAEGFTTLRFGFRGSSASPLGYTGVNGAVIDASNAIEFLKSNPEVCEVGIAGYSFGASTAMRVALLKPPPFLISLSASVDLIFERGFDVNQLAKIECPVLMFHGKDDRMISSDDLRYLAEIVKPESRNIVLLEREGHFYQNALTEVASTIRDFIRNLVSQ